MSMNLASISRLGMRLTESLSEHTRDLSITRGSSSLYLDVSEEKFKNIAKQLDSMSDREKLDAMKKLIAVSHVLRLGVLVQLGSCLGSSFPKDGMFQSILLKLSKMLLHKTWRLGS